MGILGKIKSTLFPPAKEAAATGGRAEWSSRSAFILAAMGSAVGLGNVLRFPGVVWKTQAGVAFFIPYLLGLFLVGIPILMLELVLGQTARSGDLKAFGMISRRLRGIGVASSHAAYSVSLYYNVIIGYIILYFINSFRKNLPWKGGFEQSESYFMNDITKTVNAWETEYINGPLWAAGLAAWALVYLCIWKGVLSAGKVIYVCMLLPTLFLIVLVGRSVSLPNAGRGIKLYFGNFDAAQLSQGTNWVEPVSHIFFSLSIAFGTMTAYASYNSPMANVVKDCFIIAFANSTFEVLAAFSVFGVIGFLDPAKISSKLVGTFSMGFMTFPVALAEIPGAQFWCALFFFTLFLLGVTSAFSLVETASTTLKDSRWLQKYSAQAIAGGLCLVGVAMLGLFASDIGLLALDSVDTFINNFGLLFLALVKAWSSTNMYDTAEAKARVGFFSLALFNMSWLIGPMLGTAIGYATSLAAGLGIGFGTWFAMVLLSSIVALRRGGWGCVSDLLFFQIRRFQHDINFQMAEGKTKLPIVHPFILKYVTTPALAIMQIVVFYTTFVDPDNKKVDMQMSWLGLIFTFIIPFVFFLGMAFPNMFEFLLPAKDEKIDMFGNEQVTGPKHDPEPELYKQDTAATAKELSM
ncbi:hypothetical protein HDU85_001159 [Gaertneriomyces sp. JEL0708]|nr:hypothetical protein HDU85_001159 [Gaertneriomyces sp. JEL0708]